MKSYKRPGEETKSCPGWGGTPLASHCPFPIPKEPQVVELDNPHIVQLGKLRFRVAKDLLS